MIEKAPNFCPRCLMDVTNGIGPADLPLVTEFLHMLPSSHIFYEAANWHDIAYHLGTTELDRKNADRMFLGLMKSIINIRCNFYSKPWYRLSAYRNYFCVRLMGSKFFNYKGCK